MIRNALVVATLAYVVLVAISLKECAFLAPIKMLIWEQYGTRIVIFSVLFIFNAFAASYTVFRKVALKDTGDKLAHVEKQLRGRETISEELTTRIFERK